MKSSKNYTDSLDAYRKVIRLLSNTELKGKTMPYTSRNGHMYSILSKEGVLGLRLDIKNRKNFEEKYNTKPFEQYGATMKEYVTVPDELLHSPKRLLRYLKMSIKYVDSLEPK